ncbi:GNAT family N-acetyltransferase [Pseudomonas sp. 681]|uniref:GNAT family N-acetyltransferase n=1 Tax=Pseudomonas fungipugnans TaxID=3024217 RepID=A0ABT6QQD3_9PSED|nr:GNAT family N-acetyltransferase [Pseudomonas sp. 681]MDI2593109.1 GNAT family N-acetyltransferase [Pseudomonas sp. 681]
MSDEFDPLVDFYGRRRLLRLRALTARLPAVQLETLYTNQTHRDYLYPNPKFLAAVQTVDGQQIGILSYGINPLNDRLYVFQIEIQREYRRQGYGLAVLWTLSQQHGLLIMPNHITGTALDFWRQAREILRSVGGTIGEDLRFNQMEEEKARWAHLVPEPEHLRLIREYEASH